MAADKYDRRIKEPLKEPPDYRAPAERDYDRVLYTSAFRRLQGVTQVVAADEGHVFHNRLTHSLRVAQVARRLAQKVTRQQSELATTLDIDPDVAEAAALAHDLGHPPFGHLAETELNQLVTSSHVVDGFEGNAQSFRVVTKLARRSPDYVGLNLTRGTLNAILKYPWRRQPGEHEYKWGAYASEDQDFMFARELQPYADDDKKCVEAEIMDWADDVTYAIHDADDFFRAGMIPMHRLSPINDNSERSRFWEGIAASKELLAVLGGDPSQFKESFDAVVTSFPINDRYKGAYDQRTALRDYSSGMIGRYIDAFKIKERSDRNERYVEIDSEAQRQVKTLKMLTWYYVIHDSSLATQQFGQRSMISSLFKTFVKAGTDRSPYRNIFPHAFRRDLDEAKGEPKQVARVVCDLLSSLTERQVIRLHQRLSGGDRGSVLEALVT
jgi:dGTPase